jgi:hypothetical protein
VHHEAMRLMPHEGGGSMLSSTGSSTGILALVRTLSMG